MEKNLAQESANKRNDLNRLMINEQNCIHLPDNIACKGSGSQFSNWFHGWWVCELVHNVVFESRRITRTYIGVFDWLVSYAVCDSSDLNKVMTNSS